MSYRLRNAAKIDREVRGLNHLQAFEDVFAFWTPSRTNNATEDSVREKLARLRTTLLHLPKKDFVRYQDRFNALAREYNRSVSETSSKACVTA